ncbi:hypothetical protein FOMPIDRAFT_1020329 [Fomitopsis schrenkii]|uniref:NADAR domain-containing protein n=1 Tax=Fomitopsis schrenkii TaxID=2126942 RepID=S8DK24_FOMSC|nr:hypothetical protein FOMPIDRAFT_1020329 [Fomitopsis schrenkii]
MADSEVPYTCWSTSPMDVDDPIGPGKHELVQAVVGLSTHPVADAPVIPEAYANGRSYSASPPPFQPPANPDYSRPLYFYHRHEPYFKFTNFSLHPIIWDGHTYPTAEHSHIRRLRSPREALEEAGRMRRLQRSDWFEVNVGIMDDILYAKFTQHPDLKASLLATGNRELVEDSPVDSFWGCGRDGQGRNELGKALMRLRDRLRHVY